MQVTETLAEGLKREFKIHVPAGELDEKLSGRLDALKDRVRINGFRPGKVPVAHLRKVYGKAVMGEVIQEIVAEANRKIVDDNGLKLAMQPKVDLPEDEAEVTKVLDGKSDLDFAVALELLPQVVVGDLKAVSVTRPVAPVTDADVADVLERVAKSNRPYAPKAEGEAAAEGDRVTMNYKGTIGGEPFEGGTGEGIDVDIGSNTFIPGFEAQLIGAKVGETRTITATFPEAYMRRDLAGKEGVFEVEVTAIQAPGERPVDDELAASIGLESLDKLKEAAKTQLERDHAAASRRKVKRQLLDALDAAHKFELPPTLVEQEFENIWRQVEQDLAQAGKSFTDEGADEAKTRAEYREIAERRVRLGLLLAEIGEKAGVQVTDEELQRAIVERARQFPGQEQRIWDFYRKNVQAQAELRAPIFEEKVVDYILELARVDEKPVTREELFQDDEEAAAA